MAAWQAGLDPIDRATTGRGSSRRLALAGFRRSALALRAGRGRTRGPRRSSGPVRPASTTSASAARPAPAAAPSPGWSAAARLEGLRPRAARGDRPAAWSVATDEVRALDELAPSVVQDWLLPLREEHYAPQEAYLDHLAKLVEAIGRAGESIIVGRGGGLLPAAAETLSVAVIAPLRSAPRGWPSGWASRSAPPAGPRRTSTAAGSSSIARCTAPTRTTPTTSTSCSTPRASAWRSPRIIVRAVEAGRPRASPPALCRPGSADHGALPGRAIADRVGHLGGTVAGARR